MLIQKQCSKLFLIENLDQAVTMFSILEKAGETTLDLSQGTVRVLWMYFA